MLHGSLALMRVQMTCGERQEQDRDEKSGLVCLENSKLVRQLTDTSNDTLL